MIWSQTNCTLQLPIVPNLAITPNKGVTLASRPPRRSPGRLAVRDVPLPPAVTSGRGTTRAVASLPTGAF